MPANITQSMAVDGVNTIQGLVQVRFRRPSGTADSLSAFPRVMAERHKNMNLFLGWEAEGEIRVMSCVAAEDGDFFRQWAGSIPGLEDEACRGAGLVSVFPHRSSLQFAGLAMTALSKAGIPVYGFCSSLSALTFIVAQSHVEKADAALRHYFNLPTGS